MFAALSRRFLQAARPIPARQRVAYYYVKPKKKKGPSGQAWLALAGVSATITGVGIYVLGRPDEQIAGLEVEPDKYINENVVKAYLHRAWDRIIEFRKVFAEPSSEKLLPDMLPPPYQRPYTLIIEMNDVLMHSEYDRNVGWKYQKRPGVDALFMQLFDFYEIIIFTSENAIAAHPLVAAMDPNQFVLYSLFRDSTKYIDGKHVKDLTHLNRPLTKAVIIDTDPQSVRFHRENSVILDKWTGDIHDKTLFDLVPFLLTIAVHGVDDVRPVLDFYKSQGEGRILETFRLNQARLREEEERERAERERMASQRGTHHIGGAIPTFQFGSRHRQPQQPSSQPQADTELRPPSPSQDTQPPSTPDDSPWSVTKWVASWVGWK